MDSKIRSWFHRILRVKTEALWVLVGQTGNAVGILLGMKILTQFLSPFEFGRLSIANTVVLFVSISLFGPLANGFMRFWSISHDRGQVEEFAFIADRYAGWLLFLVLSISFVFSIFCFRIGWLMAVALMVGAARGYFGLRLAVLLGARKRKIVALMNGGAAFLKPLAATLLVFLIVSNAECAMWGYLIPTLAILFLVEHFYKHVIEGELNRSLIRSGNTVDAHKMGKEILAFSWPFCVWGIFVWIHQSCDRWSLLAFHGADVVGAFSVVALVAAYPLMFASGVMLNLFMPVAYERAGDLSSRSGLKSAYQLILAMTVVYGFGAMMLIGLFGLFHETIILLMSNAEYVGFSYLLPALTLSWAFFYLGESLAAFGFIAKKPNIYIYPKVISAIIAALSAFYLSSEVGVRGVVWALGVSGGVYAAWCTVLAIRLFKEMSLRA
jgi:O-antigen/teichoic acid export membrane protein